MDWRLVTFIVCAFGFFKDLRPSEAYLTPYLTGHWKNLTEAQVDNEIYPWWTYSYLVWLIPMFLVTDYLRYKPVLILDGLAYIATWALLLWAQGVPAMKVMQVTYGLATACEIGYYSYLFAVVEKSKFKKVASISRAAFLAGRFVAYLLSQLFVSFELLDYFQLNIFSFVSVCVAFLITLVLPRAKYSELFHEFKYEQTIEVEAGAVNEQSTHDATKHEHVSRSDSVEEIEPKDAAPTKTQSPKTLRNFLAFLWVELRTIYTSKTVLIWSIWWAFASCGNFQVGNYIQNLWSVIAPHKESRHTYNGAVEAAGTLLSNTSRGETENLDSPWGVFVLCFPHYLREDFRQPASNFEMGFILGSISVLLFGFLPIDWSVRGRAEIMISVVCAVNAAFLIVMGRTTEIWVAYVLYDVFRTTYQVVITIASAQIARSLVRQRYGFVFGCNTFIALLIETILTAIVVDKAGFGVDVRTQFIVYGCYFVVMAAIFLTAFLVSYCRSHRGDSLDPRHPGISNGAYSGNE